MPDLLDFRPYDSRDTVSYLDLRLNVTQALALRDALEVMADDNPVTYAEDPARYRSQQVCDVMLDGLNQTLDN